MAKEKFTISTINLSGLSNQEAQREIKKITFGDLFGDVKKAWQGLTNIWNNSKKQSVATSQGVSTFDDLKKQFESGGTGLSMPSISIDNNGSIVVELDVPDYLSQSEKSQFVKDIENKISPKISSGIQSSPIMKYSDFKEFPQGTSDLRKVWENNPDLKKEFPTFEGKGISGDWDMVEWSKRYPSDYQSKLSKLGTTTQQDSGNQAQQVKDAYQSIVGRQPDASELKHHVDNNTGLSHLKSWLTENKSSLVTTTAPSTTSIPATTNQPFDTTTGTPATTNQPFDTTTGTPATTNQTAGTGQKPYIRHPNGIDVYDRNGNRITAEQAAAIPGFWEQVEVIDTAPNTNNGVGDTTTPGTPGTPGATTGTTISPSDYAPLTEDQLWEYWQEIRENTENGGMGPKLYEIYINRPDLQAVYDSSGNAIPGKGADGFTMQHWAMEFGWKENPDLIMYKPENVVRSVYRFPFRGEDPFAQGTFDNGAADYVNAIKNRQLTTIDGLLGAMRTDDGGEWGSLTDSQQAALIIDAYIPVEGLSKIPKFSEFWDESKARKSIETRVNDVYSKLMGDYLEGKEIDERRYIEDWSRLAIGDLTDGEIEDLKEGRETAETLKAKLESEGRGLGEITEDEQRSLTDVQRRFTQALKQATEGYASAGLTYSSLREAGETGLREELSSDKTGIQTGAERSRDAAARAAGRGQEDIEFDIKTKTTEIEERDKPKEIETAVSQRRAEELTKYDLLKSQTEEDIQKQREEALKKGFK